MPIGIMAAMQEEIDALLKDITGWISHTA